MGASLRSTLTAGIAKGELASPFSRVLLLLRGHPFALMGWDGLRASLRVIMAGIGMGRGPDNSINNASDLLLLECYNQNYL